MKIRLFMKTPNVVEDTITIEVLNYKYKLQQTGISKEELDKAVQDKQEFLDTIFEKWFSYQENIQLEIDTDSETIRVVERGT